MVRGTGPALGRGWAKGGRDTRVLVCGDIEWAREEEEEEEECGRP